MRIHLVDSESVSAGLQLLVRSAVADAGAGGDAAAVARLAEQRRKRVTIYVVLDTLTYLQRGGRIGRAQALVGSLLSVKPLLTVEEGEVAPQARVRSLKQGVDRIVELLRTRLPLRGLAAFHCGSPQLLPPLVDRLKQLVPALDVLTGQIGPVVGAYAGPGGIGIASLGAD
jgi:DegV family protein with EDD domain